LVIKSQRTPIISGQSQPQQYGAYVTNGRVRRAQDHVCMKASDEKCRARCVALCYPSHRQRLFHRFVFENFAACQYWTGTPTPFSPYPISDSDPRPAGTSKTLAPLVLRTYSPVIFRTLNALRSRRERRGRTPYSHKSSHAANSNLAQGLFW